jgi:hypothetical protein
MRPASSIVGHGSAEAAQAAVVAFRWLGEFSTDGGATWRLRAEFKCRRKAWKFHQVEEVSMFDHVSIGVRDLARAKRFYDAALRPLGHVCLSENADALGYGRDKIGLS